MQHKLPGILFLSGCALLVVVLITGWILLPFVIKNQIEGESVLENGTRLWEQWKDGLPYKFTVYIFNVTNPEEIKSGGEPIVEEIGPYIYSKTGTRTIIKESTENDTVIYKDIFIYQFMPQLSNGTEEDEIIVLNIPFLGVAQQLYTLPFYLRFLAESYVAKFKSEVFVRRTVQEFIFKGRYERLVYEMEILTRQTYTMNSTFGVLRDSNATDSGEIEIYSGKKDVHRVGETISWKGKPELDFWNGAYCNMITGTDGTVFPPFISKEKNLFLFPYAFCRSVLFLYDDEEEIMGIHGYRFTADIMNKYTTENADYRCFCLEKDFDKCFLPGVYSISSCQKDAPIAISNPHFYGGHPSYSQKFGLRPDSHLHGNHFTLEPNTGTPLQITQRVQINAIVKNLPNIEKFKKIQTMVFPLIWAEESYNMNEDKAAEIKSRVTTPLKIIEATTWILICFSLFLIFGSVIIFLLRVRRKQVFV